MRVVVRDLLGREQVISVPFYASASLLAKGLHDFSYEAGAERRNFGTDSNDYGRAFAAATHRLGFTDWLTGEVHAESQLERQTVGLGTVMLAPSVGVFSAAAAASRDGRAVEASSPWASSGRPAPSAWVCMRNLPARASRSSGSNWTCLHRAC